VPMSIKETIRPSEDLTGDFIGVQAILAFENLCLTRRSVPYSVVMFFSQEITLIRGSCQTGAIAPPIRVVSRCYERKHTQDQIRVSCADWSDCTVDIDELQYLV
jgi:hypothetical protein